MDLEKSYLWIRTFAGAQAGFGHLRRALVLAEALHDSLSPIFLLDPDDTGSQEQASRRGWRFAFFKLSEIWASLPLPAGILIDTREPDGLDALISEANARNIPVISIHDLGLNPLASDIIIDGSIRPIIPETSDATSHSYTGPNYLVLDPAYRFLHGQRKRIREHIQLVVINLGGGDSRRFYPKLLEGLKLWGRNVEVIGIPGFASWGQEELAAKDWQPLRFRWANREESIARLLFGADLAITAGGLSAYEALCVGTPLLIQSCDGLQQITVSALAQANACQNLGRGDLMIPIQLPALLELMDGQPKLRKSLSMAGKTIIDGRGAERVSRIVCGAVQAGPRSIHAGASL